MKEFPQFHALKAHPFSPSADAAIQVKLNETRATLHDLSLDMANKPQEEQALFSECNEWLGFATRQLGKLQLPQLPFGFDAAYAGLHKIRHHLCLLLPREKLHELAMEIESDLDYIHDDEKRKQLGNKLEELAPYLDPVTPAPTAGGALSVAQVRYRLKQLSMLVGESRETIWRKVNLLRMRLFTTLVALVILLLVSIPVLYIALKPQLGLFQIIGIQLLGAIGGAISALRTREEINLRSTQYYLKQTVLYLRPAVGAAAGLALALVQLSGTVAIFPQADPELQMPLILLVAFLGGFSERFFLGRMDKIVAEKAQQPEAGKQETSRPASE